MSLEREHILAAIQDCPDDDSPRLLYADWLDEHGDVDRASFIRVAIQCNNLWQADPRRDNFTQRYWTLLRRNINRWLAEEKIPAEFSTWLINDLLPGHASREIESAEIWEFDRGLFVGLSFQALYVHPQAIVKLLASPHLTHISSLNFEENIYGDEVAIALAASPYVVNITSLNLGNNGDHRWPQAFNWQTNLTDLGIIALSRSAQLSNLKCLRLRGTNVVPQGVAALAASPYFSNLSSLDLSCTFIGSEGVQSLASSRCLSKLASLDIFGHEDERICESDVIAVLESSNLANLASLNVASNWLGDSLFQELASSPGLNKLRSLNVANSGACDEGIYELVTSPHIANLRDLVLWDYYNYSQGLWSNELSMEAALELSAIPYFATMTRSSYFKNYAKYVYLDEYYANPASLILDDHLKNRIYDDIAPKVAAHEHYQRVMQMTPKTARTELDAAMMCVIEQLLKDDTEFNKQFVLNETFRFLVVEMVQRIIEPSLSAG